ncbi:hypothetical protein DID88_000264 [Monilinia fructigena]|uniref:Response regulatory domain-containing protein n=1 Tax=Monilinia fructigena TaxID=38457 RepID=A0A395IQ67_9HELO|nr:hypothetical protein DID88_000264 [Monilinia fructigena]
MGDPGRVRQIITNLLTNSIKFTSEGRVKFSVIKEKEDADTIEVKFVVEDTGIGIEEEVRKRLFKPFSQADSSTARRFGGTGLGLTISKNLVDLMHGRITLESSLGQEQISKFFLLKITPLISKLLLRLFEKLGFSPFAVWNGKEALDYLLAAESPNPPHPKPDIILMDVQMPIIDGYRATHIIRHHSPYNHSTRNIPIVAMTASAIQGDREKCKKAGMDDYLAKPVKGKRWKRCCDCVEGDNDNCSRRRGKSKFDRRTSTSTARHHSSKSIDKSETQAPESPTDSYTNKRASQSQTFKLETDPANKPKPSFDPARPPKDQTHSPLEVSRPAKNDRHHSHHLTLPQPEDEGERAVRREVFEEKAKELRDEKLVGAASDEHGLGVVHGHGHGDRKSEVMAREEGASQAPEINS